MAEKELKVENQAPGWIPKWFQDYYAGTPGGRVQEVLQPGSVPGSPVGQPEPQQYGISALGGVGRAIGRGIEEQALNVADAIGRFFTSRPQAAPGEGLGSRAYSQTGAAAPDLGGLARTEGRRRMSVADRLAQSEPFRQAAAAQEPAGQTFEDFLAQYGGSFDASPYDRAADYMMERRQAQLEAIQNMYNQYAAEAEANAARVADIYGGAEAGIGETYAGSEQAIADAYASAQQQAADQMARLGIEQAAPAVIDPMALSQAETLSGLQTNRASGLGAIQQFGASGRNFASNMAQIAQQQAVENQRAATEQLADQLFELEMQRAQAEAAYNPYAQAMQRLELERAFYEPQLRAMEAQSEADQAAAQLQLETTLSRRDKIIQIWTDIREAYETDEEAMAAAEAAVSRAEQLYPMQ